MKSADKNTNPKSAFKTFIILGVAMFALNIHFLIFTQKFDTSDFFDMRENGTNLNLMNETLAWCHASPRSRYFNYLTEIFPW